MCRCDKCKSENVTLTNTEDYGIGGRIHLIMMGLGCVSTGMMFFGLFGFVIGAFIGMAFLIKACGSMVERTYHCNVCGHVTKIVGGEL